MNAWFDPHAHQQIRSSMFQWSHLWPDECPKKPRQAIQSREDVSMVSVLARSFERRNCFNLALLHRTTGRRSDFCSSSSPSPPSFPVGTSRRSLLSRVKRAQGMREATKWWATKIVVHRIERRGTGALSPPLQVFRWDLSRGRHRKGCFGVPLSLP